MLMKMILTFSVMTATHQKILNCKPNNILWLVTLASMFKRIGVLGCKAIKPSIKLNKNEN